MVSGLAERIDRILPFAERVLVDATHEDTEQLEMVIERMYNLAVDIAEFILGYVQRTPGSTFIIVSSKHTLTVS